MAYGIDTTIDLVSRKATGRNTKGQPTYTTTIRTVYARAESVSRDEFFEAGQAGILASWLFIMNPVDYQNELLVSYEGRTFRIYRTYRRAMDELEIYASQEVGYGTSNNQQQTPAETNTGGSGDPESDPGSVLGGV